MKGPVGMPKVRAFLLSVLFVTTLHILAYTVHAQKATDRTGGYRTDVVLFYPSGPLSRFFNRLDIRSYEKIAKEFGLSTGPADFSFINTRLHSSTATANGNFTFSLYPVAYHGIGLRQAQRKMGLTVGE